MLSEFLLQIGGINDVVAVFLFIGRLKPDDGMRLVFKSHPLK